MDKLPDVCKDCAEYGSEFCQDCLDELAENLTAQEKIVLSQALKRIARAQEVPSTDTPDT
jgi:hypothetical protein